MKMLGITIIVALTMFVANVLAADTTATVNVLDALCGISGATSIDFGSMGRGIPSSDVISTVTASGDTEPSVTLSGTNWCSGVECLFTMVVDQTHWSLDQGIQYNSMTTLKTDPGDVLLGTFDLDVGTPVYFKLEIPSPQAAGSYSQTITFTASC